MRILHLLTGGGIGGIEILCRDIAQYSQDENHFAFVFFGGDICNEMKASGYNVYEYDSRKFSRATLKKLKALCLQYNIEIIQVHHRDMFLYWFALELKKKDKNIRIITTVHSCYQKGFYYPPRRRVAITMMNHFVKAMFKASDGIVSVSEAGYRSFLEFNRRVLESKPHPIVYNGISPELLERGRENIINQSGETVSLVYIGRIEDFKGIENLVHAVCELAADFPLRLLVVGDGSKKEEYSRLSQELRCDDVIRFAGSLRGQALEDARKGAQFLVYPSIWQEIFGVSILECMAFGLVPIVNRVGGIPEIVDESCGIITGTSDTAGLKEAIVKAAGILRSGEFIEMSNNAKKRAGMFSITRTIEALSEVYQNIMVSKAR